MKKIVSLLLLLSMVLILVSCDEKKKSFERMPDNEFGEGIVEDNPVGAIEITQLTKVPDGYMGIYTKEDLDVVRNNLSGNYILMTDIEFTAEDFADGGCFYNGDSGWMPIGDEEAPFAGNFDGNGYAVKNLYVNINSSSTVYVGLFGYNKGSIKNLVIKDAVVIASISNAKRGSNVFVGGIVGYSSEGIITNCYNTGNVSAYADTNLSSVACAGGIVGYSKSNIVNCSNTGSVSAKASSSTDGCWAYAGGIAGTNASVISYCNNKGGLSAVASTSSDLSSNIVSVCAWSYVGGITGENYGTITNCNNTGIVNAYSNSNKTYSSAECIAGGIAGRSAATIHNCYNTGDVGADASSPNPEIKLGGIAGFNYYDGDISNCYNTGRVSAVTSYSPTCNYYTDAGEYRIWIGGIAGYSKSNIVNCYNMGDVSTFSSGPSPYPYKAYLYVDAGGIAGYSSGGDISNSYNIGMIDINESISSTGIIIHAGGIAGDNDNGTITNCYYLNNINSGVGDGTDTCVKCTDEQMKKRETFADFDFEQIWTMKGDPNYPYPELRG